MFLVSQSVGHLFPDVLELMESMLDKEADEPIAQLIVKILCHLDPSYATQKFDGSESLKRFVPSILSEIPLDDFGSIDVEDIVLYLSNGAESISDKIQIYLALLSSLNFINSIESGHLCKLFNTLVFSIGSESNQMLKSMLIHLLGEFASFFSDRIPNSLIFDIVNILSSTSVDNESRKSLLDLAMAFIQGTNSSLILLPICKLLKFVDCKSPSKSDQDVVHSIFGCIKRLLRHNVSFDSIQECMLCHLLPFLREYKDFGRISSLFSTLLDDTLCHITEDQRDGVLKKGLKFLLRNFDPLLLNSFLSVYSNYTSHNLQSLQIALESLDVLDEPLDTEVASSSKVTVLPDGSYGHELQHSEKPSSFFDTATVMSICESYTQYFSKQFSNVDCIPQTNHLKAKIVVKISKLLKASSSSSKRGDSELICSQLNILKLLGNNLSGHPSVSIGDKRASSAAAPSLAKYIVTTASQSLSALFKDDSALCSLDMNLRKSKKSLSGKSSISMPTPERLSQMTGFTDPLYVESFISLVKDHITIEFLVVNQTTDCTFTNIHVEFALKENVKVVESCKPVHLPPCQFCLIKYIVRSSSDSCSSSINSSISFNVMNSSHSNAPSGEDTLVLDPLVIPVIEFIVPSNPMSFDEFTHIWQRLEWENKISIGPTSKFDNFNDLASKIVSAAKLQFQKESVLALQDSCGFFSVNIYGKSVFDDDICANLSLEKHIFNGMDSIKGHLRLRSQSQSIALALGDVFHSVVVC